MGNKTTSTMLFDDEGNPPMTARRKPGPKPRQDVAKVEPASQLPVAAPNLLSSLVAAMNDPACNPDKLHALLDARGRLLREQAEVEFTEAYIRLQNRMPSITKDGTIDQGQTRSGRQGVKSKFASYENIYNTVKPILSEEKFGIFMMPDAMPDGSLIVRGELSYVCSTDYGKVVFAKTCTIPVPSDPTGGKSPPQGIGSAAQYGKRYCIIALLNIISHAVEDKDDDGRARGRPKETVIEISIITKTQVEEIRKLIEDCGATEAMFCGKFEIESLEQLPVAQIGEAKQACKNFKDRKGNAQKGKDDNATGAEG